MPSRTLSLALALVALLFATGCPDSSKSSSKFGSAAAKSASKSESEAAPQPKDGPLAASPYEVKCGCALPIRKCSEWAKVDGAYVEITGDLKLGSMPFCGKADLKATIEGEVKEGKIHATKLEVLKP